MGIKLLNGRKFLRAACFMLSIECFVFIENILSWAFYYTYKNRNTYRNKFFLLIERMQNEASFWDKRSAMFFPAIDATYAIDVSFYFKTRSVEGVFISMTGATFIHCKRSLPSSSPGTSFSN